MHNHLHVGDLKGDNYECWIFPGLVTGTNLLQEQLIATQGLQNQRTELAGQLCYYGSTREAQENPINSQEILLLIEEGE